MSEKRVSWKFKVQTTRRKNDVSLPRQMTRQIRPPRWVCLWLCVIITRQDFTHSLTQWRHRDHIRLQPVPGCSQGGSRIWSNMVAVYKAFQPIGCCLLITISNSLVTYIWPINNALSTITWPNFPEHAGHPAIPGNVLSSRVVELWSCGVSFEVLTVLQERARLMRNAVNGWVFESDSEVTEHYSACEHLLQDSVDHRSSMTLEDDRKPK